MIDYYLRREHGSLIFAFEINSYNQLSDKKVHQKMIDYARAKNLQTIITYQTKYSEVFGVNKSFDCKDGEVAELVHKEKAPKRRIMRSCLFLKVVLTKMN